MLGEKLRAAALGVCVLGSGALFQEIEPAARAQEFVLAKGDHKIPDLIERVSAFLNRNYLYDATGLDRSPGSVFSLQNEIRVDAKGCEDVFSQLLFVKGFAVVVHNSTQGIYEVINMAGSKRNQISSSAQWMTPEEVLAKRNNYTTVRTSVSLKHINANTATTAMRPFFASTGGVGGLIPGNVGNGRALLLQGFAPAVAHAIEMLRQVDVPAAALADTLTQRLGRIEARLKTLEGKK